MKEWHQIRPVGYVYDFPMPEAYSHNRDCFYAGITLGCNVWRGEGAVFAPGGVYYHPLAAYVRLIVGMNQQAFGYVIGEEWQVVE